MPRRPGAIGQGYLPKGGRPVALDMAQRKAAENAAAAAAIPALAHESVRGEVAARSRGGRLVTFEGLALIGAVAGCSALLGELLHVVAG